MTLVKTMGFKVLGKEAPVNVEVMNAPSCTIRMGLEPAVLGSMVPALKKMSH